jgi:hypothetical protein
MEAGIVAATTAAAFIAGALGASTGVPIPIKAIIPASVWAIVSASLCACRVWDALDRDVETIGLKLTNTTVRLWEDGPC